ncbi:MAG: energy transducer TonB [Deltaproteobacteria bacterium]|nr:energy transducer TonB [Deltaproteobacteria bacterium]
MTQNKSIKRFNPKKNSPLFSLFISLSVLLHAGLIFALFFNPFTFKESKDTTTPPVFVELTEPPTTKDTTHVPKEKPRLSSDKTVVVKNEDQKKPISSGSNFDSGKNKKLSNTKSEKKEEPPNKIKLQKIFPTEERLLELTRKSEALKNSGRGQRESPPKRKTFVLGQGDLATKIPTKMESGFSVSDSKYYKYILGIKNSYYMYWDYPLSSIKKGEQGKLQLDFIITRSGKIKSFKLVKSSGYPTLDDGVITALKLATPFSEFPNNFEDDEILVQGNFTYSLF